MITIWMNASTFCAFNVCGLQHLRRHRGFVVCRLRGICHHYGPCSEAWWTCWWHGGWNQGWTTLLGQLLPPSWRVLCSQGTCHASSPVVLLAYQRSNPEAPDAECCTTSLHKHTIQTCCTYVLYIHAIQRCYAMLCCTAHDRFSAVYCL